LDGLRDRKIRTFHLRDKLSPTPDISAARRHIQSARRELWRSARLPSLVGQRLKARPHAQVVASPRWIVQELPVRAETATSFQRRCFRSRAKVSS
jgi:hypothetical protein